MIARKLFLRYVYNSYYGLISWSIIAMANQKLLAITFQASVNLQKLNVDLCTTVESIEVVQSVISEIRSNIEREFKAVFKSELHVANNLGITKCMPSIFGTQNQNKTILPILQKCILELVCLIHILMSNLCH